MVYESFIVFFFYKDKLHLTYNVMIKNPVLFLYLHCYNAIIVPGNIQTLKKNRRKKKNKI